MDNINSVAKDGNQFVRSFTPDLSTDINESNAHYGQNLIDNRGRYNSKDSSRSISIRDKEKAIQCWRCKEYGHRYVAISLSGRVLFS